MPYRHTARVVRRLAARKEAIVSAALSIANENGMAAVQIAPIARRADVAAGTVYRYFPGKTELLGALIAMAQEREIAALRRAAESAPGPLSALAAAIITFAARALQHRRLAYALIAEPVDAGIEATRCRFRRAVIEEFAARIAAAEASGLLPRQAPTRAAPALFGALVEGLVGPLAPDVAGDAGEARTAVQELALMALRSLGLPDARARGLVAQVPIPTDEQDTTY
jgi:AcrR family transcriptional regulator